MKKWMAIMLLIALALFGSVIGFNMFKQKKIAEFMANRPEPEFPVTAMVTKAQDWVPTIEAIGFIEPNQGVTLSSELSGTIDSIRFESGAHVKADQLLLSLDSSVEKANLNSSQARLPAARAKFERYKNLYQKNSISRDQLDDAEASYRSLEADIVAATLTCLDHHLLGAFHAVSLVNDVDVLAIEGEGDGGLRDHDLVFHRGQYDAGAGEHAGTELAVVVRNVCLHLDQAALIVDRGLDGRDLAVKLGLGIGIHVDLDGLSQGDFGDVGLGHGEAQAHHAGVFQAHNLGTRFQILAEEDVAQAHGTAEGHHRPS